MQNKADARHIMAYEVGYEGEINWDKPVIFRLAMIDRIDKTEDGKARFTVLGSAIEPVEFVTKSTFEVVVECLGAIQ
jgi:hypothetical protein